jgi:hypothetical protein
MARMNLPDRDHAFHAGDDEGGSGPSRPRSKTPVTADPGLKDYPHRYHTAPRGGEADEGGAGRTSRYGLHTTSTGVSTDIREGKRAPAYREDTRDVDGIGSGRGCDRRLDY